jgi:hypothetical protein
LGRIERLVITAGGQNCSAPVEIVAAHTPPAVFAGNQSALPVERMAIQLRLSFSKAATRPFNASQRGMLHVRISEK